MEALHHVLPHLALSDILRLRLVCSSWNGLINVWPELSRFKICAPIPADSNPLSPLERLSLAHSIEEKALENMSRGSSRDYAIEGPLEGPLRLALHVGYCVILVNDTHWGIWEQKCDSFVAISHCIESYDRNYASLEFVVLRDRFLMLLIGGHLLSLDCGEIFDLPMVLKTNVSDGSVFYESFESVILVNSLQTTAHVYRFEEHQPFGYHVEHIREIILEKSLDSFFVGLCLRGSAYAIRTDDYVQICSLSDDSILFTSAKLNASIRKCRVFSGLHFWVSFGDEKEILMTLKDQSFVFVSLPAGARGTSLTSPCLVSLIDPQGRPVLFELASQRILECGEKKNLLGFCSANRVAYFKDRILFFGKESIWFRRLAEGQQVVGYSMGVLLIRDQESDSKLIVRSFREKRVLFE